MILFKNLVALAVAFIVAVIAVVVFEWAGGLFWPPELSGDLAAIAARGPRGIYWWLDRGCRCHIRRNGAGIGLRTYFCDFRNCGTLHKVYAGSE